MKSKSFTGMRCSIAGALELIGDRGRQQAFETLLSDYDLVLHTLDNDILERSLMVLKPGGHLISISGPPDPAYAAQSGANWIVRQVIRLLSAGIRRKAAKRGVHYSFLFMRADGEQLGKLAVLAETAYVGSLGVASLGGIALAFPTFMLMQMLSAGARGGAVSGAISRALGASDQQRA